MLKRPPVTSGEVEYVGGGLLFTCLYGAAVSLYVSPLADLFYTLIPFDGGVVQWRFGAIGFAAQTLWSQLVAIAMVAVVGWIKGHRWALRLVSTYCALLALALVAVGAVTVLDFVQLRQAVVQPMKPKLDAAATRLFVQLGVAFFAAVPIGISAWRAGRSPNMGRTGGDELGVLYGVRAKQSSRGAT